MYTYQGRFCFIEELTQGNDKELFSFMKIHADEYRVTVSDTCIPNLYTDFKIKLREWFFHGRNYQFFVRRHENSEVLGTVFLYGLDENSRTIKCSVFFAPNARKSLLVSESLGMIVCFITNILSTDNILFSVYSENVVMQTFAKKVGASVMDQQPSCSNLARTVITYSLQNAAIINIMTKLRKLIRR